MRAKYDLTKLKERRNPYAKRLKIPVSSIKLTRSERAIEDALLRGEYVDAPRAEFEEIARVLARRRKNAVR